MLSAILWDFDGTLADTVEKNRTVTIEILRRVDPTLLTPMPTALVSNDAYRVVSKTYRNWMELYEKNYHMTPAQIAAAAPLWVPCQQENALVPPIFDGIREALTALRERPMGICSQNSVPSMRAVLKSGGVETFFGGIAGFDTVGMHRQKPLPDTFFKCLDLLGLPAAGTFLYVGDQVDDVRFARAAESALRERDPNAQVVCAAVLWSGADTGGWVLQPDFCVSTPAELSALAARL